MRAIKAALLWILGVASVLLVPAAASPAAVATAAATFAHRTASSAASGQHTARPGPASSQRSGASDSSLPALAALAATKAGPNTGFTGSGVPGDRAQAAAIAPPAADLLHAGRAAAGLRSGVGPGVHLGRSPPAATPGA